METTPQSVVEYQSRIAQFDYDKSLPLDMHASVLEWRRGIAVRDLTFASVGPGRVAALLVTPSGDSKYPAVIFVHPAPGNRYTFLDEAVELAQHGAVSLLLDAPWSRGAAWGRMMGEPEHDLQEHVRTAKDLIRAIDLLTACPDVDAGHIAYVGDGFGALFGGVLAGVEKRIKTYVLMAGVGSFAHVAVLNLPQLQGLALDHYRRVLAPLDPLYYIQFAAPAPLLFQFGFQDRSFARVKFIEFAAAGSEPKAVKWYNASHDLPDPGAQRDRLDWLRMHVGVNLCGTTSPARET